MGGLLKLEPLAEPLAKAWPKARDRLLGILFFLAGSKSVLAADLLRRSDASESPVQPVSPGNLGNHWAINGCHYG